MGKRRLIMLAILVVIVAAAAVVLTLDYDSPRLGRAILERAGEQAGLDLRAEGFRLNLLRGLQLEDVEVVSHTPGSAFHARADRLVLEHRLAPLLRGQVRIVEIVLVRPAIELVSEAEVTVVAASDPAVSAAPPPEVTAPAEGGSGLDLGISRFAIVDGTLTIRDAADPEGGTTTIRGLDLELRVVALDPAAPSAMQGLTAAGELEADEVETATALAEDARGDVRMEGGHLRIEGLQLPTAQGRLVVTQLDADFNADPYTYALTVEGDPLNTNLILGAADDGGFGPARLSLDVTGDGSEHGALAGQGVLALAPGELPVLPLLAALERLVAGTEIIGEAYEPFDIRFGIRDDRLEIEPFRIVTGKLELELSGRVGFEGALALRTTLRAPREGAEAIELPKEVVEALTDADGRVNLPIAIGGSQLSPQVAFDRSGWERMARRRVESEARKEVSKALGKLFAKDDDDGP
jgi:hypothetical protein